MATSMTRGEPTPSAVSPPNLFDRQISLLAPVVADEVPSGAHFGDVIADAKGEYKPEEDVIVKFR